MNYLLLKKDKNAAFVTCFECYTKGKFKEYLANFRFESEDLELLNITCPTDIMNKYLSKNNRKNIFHKLDDNTIIPLYYLKGCICRYTLSNLIYKLVI